MPLFDNQYILKSFNDLVETLARIVHEVNRAYCESQGDKSQKEWKFAPSWQKDSARQGVILHLTTDSGPEASHESWMEQKVKDGWMYGPEKDEKLKTHPCMVPFKELPPAQQAKDYIFRAVIHAITAQEETDPCS
jgi:hypothetical protein